MSKSDEVLGALRNNAEGPTGDGWSDVYLDNASCGLAMSPTEFRACLGVLAKQGLYRVTDGWAWGQVREEMA